MKKGLVSCVIPTYKRSDTLIRAIESVLNQTYKDLEVLIVDDNEPNDQNSLIVQQRLKDVTDFRIRYIQQEKHINGAAARNVGIKAAKGEFIAFLDDDDEWLPTKIEKQVSYLNTYLGIDGVTTLYTYYFDNEPFRKCPEYSTKNLHKKVLGRTVAVCTPTILLRKTALDEAGYFDESLRRHQDLQLLLDFLVEHKIELIPEYLVIINTDLADNRGTADTVVEIKSNFFKVAKRHFECYDKKNQRDLYAAHYFEVILVALRQKRIGIVINYLIKIGFNIQAYINLYQRYRGRKHNKK